MADASPSRGALEAERPGVRLCGWDRTDVGWYLGCPRASLGKNPGLDSVSGIGSVMLGGCERTEAKCEVLGVPDC
jgi:hypothetical protein